MKQRIRIHCICGEQSRDFCLDTDKSTLWTVGRGWDPDDDEPQDHLRHLSITLCPDDWVGDNYGLSRFQCFLAFDIDRALWVAGCGVPPLEYIPEEKAGFFNAYVEKHGRGGAVGLWYSKNVYESMRLQRTFGNKAFLSSFVELEDDEVVPLSKVNPAFRPS